MPLPALIDEIAEPHRGFGVDINITTTGTGTLTVRRTPESFTALGNLIENAVDFAANRVDIEATWDGEMVHMTITDDGAGFDPVILARLGEPYVTSRAGVDPERRRPATRTPMATRAWVSASSSPKP